MYYFKCFVTDDRTDEETLFLYEVSGRAENSAKNEQQQQQVIQDSSSFSFFSFFFTRCFVRSRKKADNEDTLTIEEYIILKAIGP